MAHRRSRPRTNYSWQGFEFGPASLTATQSVIATLVQVTETLTSDQTVRRTRGSIFVHASPDAATDNDIVALGIIVVQANAAAAGGTSVPGPIADSGADWLWHSYVGFDAVSLTAYAGDAMGLNHRFEVDSKAMRIVRQDQTVILVGEVQNATFAELQVEGGIRMLTSH